MNIGRMDRRIELQSQSITRDEWNHPVGTWTTLATVWATKKERRATEPTEVSQVVALNVVEWFIRHRTDIDAGDRVKYAGNIYDITGVQEIGRAEGLRLITELRA